MGPCLLALIHHVSFRMGHSDYQCHSLFAKWLSASSRDAKLDLGNSKYIPASETDFSVIAAAQHFKKLLQTDQGLHESTESQIHLDSSCDWGQHIRGSSFCGDVVQPPACRSSRLSVSSITLQLAQWRQRPRQMPSATISTWTTSSATASVMSVSVWGVPPWSARC